MKARCIQNSSIAHAPPHVREIWDWLLKEANHQEGKSHGRRIGRGQCVRRYADIIEGLSWHVGFRKQSYTKWQCEMAMKWLTKEQMVTKKKTTRGLIITICNYDYYQNPANYESHKESHNKATMKPQTPATINKNGKKVRKERAAKPPPPRSIQIFRENTGRYPPKSWYSEIVEAVGEEPDDLRLWGKIVHTWVGLDWNPGNVVGMLDYFKRREIPGTRPGQHKGPTQQNIRR